MQERMWEYRVVAEHKLSSSFSQRLDVLGSVGWELVSVVFDPRTAEHFLYFKRDISR